jgi:Kef-type K+ transport system membrane component KefB/Trk K+ transport system NAD-binding subunit
MGSQEWLSRWVAVIVIEFFIVRECLTWPLHFSISGYVLHFFIHPFRRNMQLLPNLIEQSTRFVPLLIVLGLAFLVPILLARFRRLPVVVGEIAAGIVVGTSGLGWVTEGPILDFMGDVGLAFLMFLAGMEINFTRLFPRRSSTEDDVLQEEDQPNVLLLSLLVYMFTLLLAVPGGFLIRALGFNADPWLLAFILSATSLGVLLPILKERRLTNSPFGQFVFVSATLADFVTVILFTVYIITFDRGFDLEIFSIGLLFIAFLVFFRFGPQFVRIPVVSRFFNELSRATVQIKVRGALAILLAFVVLAEFVNAELILGAFLAGMIISLLKSPDDEGLVHRLEAFGFGFFIPIFFILVGTTLELQSLFESPGSLLLLPVILIASLAIKVLPVLTLKRFYSWRELLSGGILLNTHLSLEIAVAVIGVRVGLMDAAANVTIILFAVLTVVAMPLLFGVIFPSTQAEDKRFKLIAGVNETSLKVADELRAHGDLVLFIAKDEKHVNAVRRAGFEIIPNSESIPDAFSRLDSDQVEAFLALHEDGEKNLNLSRLARQKGIRNMVAYVVNPDLLPKFSELKVQAYTPAVQRITLISMMARSPDAFNLLSSYKDENDTLEIYLSNTSLVQRPLRFLKLPSTCLVLAIRRGDELLVPRGNTELAFGDRLTMFGPKVCVEDIRFWLENNDVERPNFTSQFIPE